jgi:serine/threonine protein kinase
MGSFSTDEDVYIVLEYMESGSLATMYKKYGAIPEPLVANFTKQALHGLEYLHSQGVIHRDIKVRSTAHGWSLAIHRHVQAANLLLNTVGTVKLADFGISSRFGLGEDTATGSLVGSPNWMAPEIIQQSGCSPSSDMWSLACTIIELLMGEPVYAMLPPVAVIFRMVEDPSPTIPASASSSLRDFLGKCFMRSPPLRPSASVLLCHAWLPSVQSDASESLANDVSSRVIPSIIVRCVRWVQRRHCRMERVIPSPPIFETHQRQRHRHHCEMPLRAHHQHCDITATKRGHIDSEGSSPQTQRADP